MAKREFLMLAHDCDKQARTFKSETWFKSEKLDGMRAFWDGGVTRGKMPRFTKGLVATGLWSRYGKIIYAPASWLNSLPPVPLDGELWLGRNRFQELVSIVKKHNPDPAKWATVGYKCFDIPGLEDVWAPGLINNPIVTLPISEELHDQMFEWAHAAGVPWSSSHQFVWTRKRLRDEYPDLYHPQDHWDGDWGYLVDDELVELTKQGGEGIMLRAGGSCWSPERSWDLLKLKKIFDSEATVLGYTFGRETDRGSKLLGKMGAMTVEWIHPKKRTTHVFDLSGFTDEEREFDAMHMTEYAREHPGEIAPAWIMNKTFPRGSSVTFCYRTTTKDGKPREAKFWRKYDLS